MSEIGQTLKSARVEKGLTLDDLQQTTKIQKRYLIAIEEENFEALPGNFYVRAFIREYAETVGLDSNDLLAQIDSELGQEPEESTPINESVTRMNLREKNKDTELTQGQKIISYLPTIVIVVIVLAIIGTIFGVSYNNKRQAQKTVDNNVEVSSETTAKKPAAKASSESKKPAAAKKKAKPAKKAKKVKKEKQKLSLTANTGSNFTYSLTNAPKKNKIALKISGGTAWNAVSADGVQTWQGTMSDGEDQTVEIPAGAQTITIQLGNSKATTITVNGKKFNFMKDNDTLTVRTLTLQLSTEDQATTSDQNTQAPAAGTTDANAQAPANTTGTTQAQDQTQAQAQTSATTPATSSAASSNNGTN